MAEQDILQKARRDFTIAVDAVREVRRECLHDRRFYSVTGAQWEDELGLQFENLVKFEINKVHLSVIRIFNEYRNNRISVNFVAKDENGDEAAEVRNGLYRADEEDSNAQEAYDNAFEEGVGGGFGAWRLRAVLEDEYADDDYQRIVMEPIFDADKCVFFDAGAKRQDKADAKQCWVMSALPRSQYIEEYDDDPATWPDEIKANHDWITVDLVYVAEYYEVEVRKEKIYCFENILVEDDIQEYSEDEFEDEELLEQLNATGYRLKETKERKSKKVHKYLMSGGKVLKDYGFIAGCEIPVVPFYGKRWYNDGREYCQGHVRLSKDVQRLKNMQMSKLGQISAMSPVEKPIVTPEQIAGHQLMWAEDSVKNYPYMMLNPILNEQGQEIPSGPVGYTKSPNIPPALAAVMQQSEQDMNDLLGNQQAGEILQPNQSGRAVELIQNRLDMQAFIYMDNMAKAMRRCGVIWLGMARDVYVDENRIMTTIDEHDQRGQIRLMEPKIDKYGNTQVSNDMRRGKIDVVTEVGPSFTTRRESTVRSLLGLLQTIGSTDPQKAVLLSNAILMNIEGDGLEDIREFARKQMVQMGAAKPTDADKEEMEAAAANAQPSAQDQFLMAEAQKAQANAIKAGADTENAVADAEKKRAETAKILADMDQQQRDNVFRVIELLQQQSPQTREPAAA